MPNADILIAWYRPRLQPRNWKKWPWNGFGPTGEMEEEWPNNKKMAILDPSFGLAIFGHFFLRPEMGSVPGEQACNSIADYGSAVATLPVSATCMVPLDERAILQTDPGNVVCGGGGGLQRHGIKNEFWNLTPFSRHDKEKKTAQHQGFSTITSLLDQHDAQTKRSKICVKNYPRTGVHTCT